ncbi:MAG: tetratricopeptide repeat protein [Gemmatimonadetes bacterium]|jgi:TolA-binding protein|nr:tetratricopeptide repeat protein [Gemmatimonadota bacterium]MBP6668637.1 tetratricopeptide repeat protein [Gemmatimonadales bacterium]MBK7716244.1 tetratricopeptide repeat protein [Gemmatimonadota bacterium]MBK7923742.1 tetratricopeptide repeat protein [Gemmatimonadota bacterium]MBK9692945.1 tetratricopeptide repeat protein [Gemmatimonadota bacterium]
MRRLRTPAVWVALVALGGCASKGDLRRVEEQLLLSRAENQRADSIRAAQLGEIIAGQRRIADSLAGIGGRLGQVSTQVAALKGDLSNDLISIAQQLVQVQALTGQSQQRLTELQTQLEARTEQLNVAPAPLPPAPGGAPADSVASPTGQPAPVPGQPSAEQVYATSLQQLRRGSPATARLGFRELLRLYPGHARVPDATYFVGETFAAEAPDSAAVYYTKVVTDFPRSSRAASALYKLGLLAERRKDLEGARGFYTRVVRDYATSDEAALARDRLKTLGR